MISQPKSLSRHHTYHNVSEEWGHLTVNKDQLLIQINAQIKLFTLFFIMWNMESGFLS